MPKYSGFLNTMEGPKNRADQGEPHTSEQLGSRDQ